MRTFLFFVLSSFISTAFGQIRAPSNDGKPVPFNEGDLSAASIKFVAKGKTFCSGYLREDKVVATAAHCFNAIREGRLQADEITVENNMKGKPVKVSKIYIHKDYKREDTLAMQDIAVVELADPIPKTHSFRLADSSQRLTTKDHYILSSYGWNPDFNEQNFSSGILRQQKIMIDEIDENGRISSKNRKGQLNCSSDSGGPLFLIKDGLVYLVGVVSGSESRNPGEDYQKFVASLPDPKSMSEADRTNATRKICNFDAVNFWTGTQKHLSFLNNPKEHGLDLTAANTSAQEKVLSNKGQK